MSKPPQVPVGDELGRERNGCVECGREQAADDRGWRAYLTVDDEVAVYCPSCAKREFGKHTSAGSY